MNGFGRTTPVNSTKEPTSYVDGLPESTRLSATRYRRRRFNSEPYVWVSSASLDSFAPSVLVRPSLPERPTLKKFRIPGLEISPATDLSLLSPLDWPEVTRSTSVKPSSIVASMSSRALVSRYTEIRRSSASSGMSSVMGVGSSLHPSIPSESRNRPSPVCTIVPHVSTESSARAPR